MQGKLFLHMWCWGIKLRAIEGLGKGSAAEAHLQPQIILCPSLKPEVLARPYVIPNVIYSQAPLENCSSGCHPR